MSSDISKHAEDLVQKVDEALASNMAAARVNFVLRLLFSIIHSSPSHVDGGDAAMLLRWVSKSRVMGQSSGF